MSLSETDLDLLADYAEGLLDGDEAAQVANRVATDQEWALAYRLLIGATAHIDHALDAYAQATPALPPEVADRIDGALAEQRRVVNAPVSLEAARRRRAARRSWVGLSAAAAVIVAVVFGLGALGLNLSNNSKSSTEAVRPNSATAGSASDSLSGVTITSTGLNYTAANLGVRIQQPNEVRTFGEPKSTGTPPNAEAVGPQLQRLSEPGGLSACLATVMAAHGGVATAVDYASYQGQPALIITLKDPDLRVAVGAACGLPNSGPNELATAPTR